MCDVNHHSMEDVLMEDTQEALNENGQVPAGQQHLRYWEIENHFKCPLIGLCMTTTEQQKLIKKVGIKWKDKNRLEIHELLVASAESDNRLSRKADSFLKRKLGKQAESLSCISEQTLRNALKKNTALKRNQTLLEGKLAEAEAKNDDLNQMLKKKDEQHRMGDSKKKTGI